MTDPRDNGNVERDLAIDEVSYRVRRRILIIGGVLPVALAITAAITALTWLPDLPDPIATHWGPGGPDGYGSPLAIVLMLLALTIGFAAFAVTGSWRGGDNLVGSQKLLVVTSPWFSVFIGTTLVGSLYVQRGLTDASTVPDIGPVVILALILSAIVGVAAWFALPPASPVPLAPSADPMPVNDGERIAWSRTVVMPPRGLWLIGIGATATLAGLIVTVVAGSYWPIALACFVVIVALLAVMVAWRVTIDHRGLHVRSAVGWPNIVIPVSDIESVRAIHVNPFAEFGGWGYRWDTANRMGVVVRAGDAIEVERMSGKRFVVTVPDAVTGASVLSAHIR